MSDMRVPEGWKLVKLEDFASIKRGITYNSDDLVDSNSLKPLYINMKSFLKDGGYNKEGNKFFGGPYSDINVLLENDLVIANTDVTQDGDIIGAPALIPERWNSSVKLHSHHVSAISIKSDLNKKFLYYLFCFDVYRSWMKRISRGTTVLMLDHKALQRTKILAPPLPEQKKIAAILTSVDDVIEKTEAQISKLQNLKKGMMTELLTKGIGHTKFKDSPVGRIPVGWEIVSLSSISERISDGIHTTPKYTDYSDYIFINGNNLKDGNIVFGSNIKYVTEEEFLKHKRDLGSHTVLMSINGTIGNLAFYRDEKVVLGKSAAYINLNSIIIKDFIYYYLGSERARRYMELELTGTTIRNLSLASIKNMPIPLPPSNEQESISTTIKSLDQLVESKIEKLDHSKSLKKALMNDLLTGKKRVNVN